MTDADAAVHFMWGSPPAPPLREREVHVWRVRFTSGSFPHLAAVLSQAERARAARFYNASDRDAFIMWHGMLRCILASYAGASPEQLEFADGPYGKPSLNVPTTEQPLEFNLSHSGGVALIAVSRGARVGVDIERWDSHPDLLELARSFFSEGERRALDTLRHVPADLMAGFFAAWSRKEAYLKALGTGVSAGLDHFEVALVPGDMPRLILDARDSTAPERWSMTALDAGDGYSAALVVEQPMGDLLLFDTDPRSWPQNL